ncbi:uncharacterized protein LOC105189049 isoform X2 [Harpegnathos saltator]|uniref:uncharacterized protein LOC105189049 isoform X2 n=1 Tax=Harpegnathos saltator TaxID=610380 RepID=UPI000590D96C|nr:uncharacterized protein LOC105189049 isoform X2 [Harpegnathos saltator]
MRSLCDIPLLLLLLLLFTCQLVTPTPIFDRDGAGSHSRYRSAGFGETVRDWFRMLKDRIVGKWHEWFGDETSSPSFSPQDILNIDKTLEKRVQGYPGLVLDLWDKLDCDSDEWDFKSWLPSLPSFPNFDWPNIHGFEVPKTTIATPRTESTTIQRQTTPTVTRTEPSIVTTTTIGTTVPIEESIATSAESTPPTTATQLTTVASAESTEELSSSDESSVINDESTVLTTESIATTDEGESGFPMFSTILTPTEPTVTASQESTVMLVLEEVTTTESPTDLTLPALNKRIEDNETIEKRTKTRKNRPSSVEVVM